MVVSVTERQQQQHLAHRAACNWGDATALLPVGSELEEELDESELEEELDESHELEEELDESQRT